MNMLSLSLLGFVALSSLSDLARASTPEIEHLIAEKDVFPPEDDEGTLPGETDEQEDESPSSDTSRPKKQPFKSSSSQSSKKNKTQGTNS